MDALKLRTLAGISSAVLLLGSVTLAEAAIPQRQQRQQNRIYQGIRSGQLTRREFKKLEKEQYRIQRDKQRAKADGNFTPRERRRINRELNRSSRHIYREKHDDQTRS